MGEPATESTVSSTAKCSQFHMRVFRIVRPRTPQVWTQSAWELPSVRVKSWIAAPSMTMPVGTLASLGLSGAMSFDPFWNGP
ncbi:MAG: hypothetical protein R3C15_00800 [Thermoleophilia bacterium]